MRAGAGKGNAVRALGNYPAVIRAIAETGYTGYVAQEFLPQREPLQSLREAVKLCEEAQQV